MLNSIEKRRFFVSEQYIQASKNLIDGMLANGNPLAIISNDEISSRELVEGLKDSSQSIILPALFCLYQGVELLLKGFVNIKSEKKNGHEAEKLLKQFLTLYEEEKELIALFNKLIYEPKTFIKQYMQTNQLDSINTLYNSLRYSERKGRIPIDHYKLMYPNNEELLPELIDLVHDIDQLLRWSVKLFRKLEDSA